MAPTPAHREQLTRAARRLEAELGRVDGLGACDPIVLPAWAAVAIARHLATPGQEQQGG